MADLNKSIVFEDNYSFYLDKDELLGQKYSIATAIYICFYKAKLVIKIIC